MPIRINLLAEQQTAEEMRRRDPVKRAFWAGGILVAAVVLWSVSLQSQVSHARAELDGLDGQWKQTEPRFLQVSNELRRVAAMKNKLEALQGYGSNRFLWTEPLNALQFADYQDVRLDRFYGNQVFVPTPLLTLKTNLSTLLPEKSWWQWWSEPPEVDIPAQLEKARGTLTNHSEMVRFQPWLKTDMNVSTARVAISGSVEVTRPATVAERIQLKLRARDYSKNPPGQRMDRYYASLTNTQFFSRYLRQTNTTVQPEYLQARPDPDDPLRPDDPFIPFTVDCAFPERIRAR